MRTPTLTEIALLDAEEAVRRHFDARNWRVGRFFWFLLTATWLGAAISAFANDAHLRAAVSVAALAALAGLALSRRSPALQRSFPSVLLAFVGLQCALWFLSVVSLPAAISFGVTLLPALLVALRLRPYEHLALFGVALGAVAIRGFFPQAPEPEPTSLAVALTAIGSVAGFAAVIGAAASARQRREFLLQWQRVRASERDRVRMRAELESARAIQLSMLPRATPALDWLEVAAACLPASEVGGDYYDYFDLGDGRFAVAVGDVAGHGVASGIVLAGVRAGLHLLRADLARPEPLLERLNEIVRDAGPERLLMTLGIAIFERATVVARWVAAGHPPALRYEAASGRVVAVEGHSPPLGTRLPARYEATAVPFPAGDVWLLVSDGALEARDAGGEPFGERRLATALAELAPAAAGAQELLDGLIAEIERHRGGGEAEDDLTLVVVRRPAGR